MSAQGPAPRKRLLAPDITAKKGREQIVSLTSYHAHTAAIADKYCDFLLVGDSLGMVMHGYETTVPVPLELMVMHGRAVVRGARRALVVVDMPFGTYEESPSVAFRNAARVMKETDCGAVKLEGGRRMAETIRFLVDRGIPVMAHIGLTPQSINTLGGFKSQGHTREQWDRIEEDARLVAEAGAFAVVLEAMAEPLARRITAAIRIPTIGIGAGAGCDGQILVMEDMLGLSPRVPKFVKEFGAVGAAIEGAIKGYAEEVRAGTFPAPEHTYALRPEGQEALRPEGQEALRPEGQDLLRPAGQDLLRPEGQEALHPEGQHGARAKTAPAAAPPAAVEALSASARATKKTKNPTS